MLARPIKHTSNTRDINIERTRDAKEEVKKTDENKQIRLAEKQFALYIHTYLYIILLEIII